MEEHEEPTTLLLEAMVRRPDARFFLEPDRSATATAAQDGLAAAEETPSGWAPLSLNDTGNAELWRERLAGSSCVLLNVIPARVRTVAALEALVPALMAAARLDAHVAFLLGSDQATLDRFAGFRDALASYPIEWVVWGGGGAGDAVSWLLVVASPTRNEEALVRVVEGRGLPLPSLLERIRACAGRKGGTTADTAVRRQPLGLGETWSWAVLSGQREQLLKDTRFVGTLQPFSAFADVRAGLHARASGGHVRELDEDERLPENHARMYNGADIRRDGTLGIAGRCIDLTDVVERNLLRAGDVLISQISRLPLRVAVVEESHPPAIAGPTLLHVRFREDLSPDRRRLFVAYMRSGRFGSMVAQRASMLHDTVRITASSLNEASLPAFDDSIVDAMRRLEDAQSKFSQWASSIAATRDEFLDAPSFETALPEFLDRSRVAQDQVAAAVDVDTLEGRIRQRFPHPLAHRFESIHQMDHNLDRVRETLVCAEYLVLFLAFLGLANLSGRKSSTLKAWSAGGSLSLDWGKADSLLREAAAKTAGLKEPLAAPVPELGSLHLLLVDPTSELNVACREMRSWRNDDAHLTRYPPDVVMAASERFTAHLKTLFSAASMLTQTPLVEVEAFERDPISDEPLAKLKYVTGVSSVFKRGREPIADVAPGYVGILDVHGRFHQLNPWLLRRTCGTCNHAETFILSRFEKNAATYIAMESGHKLTDPTLNEKLEKFISKASAE